MNKEMVLVYFPHKGFQERVLVNEETLPILSELIKEGGRFLCVNPRQTALLYQNLAGEGS